MNDNFTTAAKEVADREFPDGKAGKSGNPERIAFQAGAEWARTHLAAQEPTDAEVRVAAMEIHDLRAKLEGAHQRLTPHSFFDEDLARAALTAARAAGRDTR